MSPRNAVDAAPENAPEGPPRERFVRGRGRDDWERLPPAVRVLGETSAVGCLGAAIPASRPPAR